jgi:hypothetical protein
MRIVVKNKRHNVWECSTYNSDSKYSFALRKLRQEDQKFQASLVYRARLSQKQNKNKNKTENHKCSFYPWPSSILLFLQACRLAHS